MALENSTDALDMCTRMPYRVLNKNLKCSQYLHELTESHSTNLRCKLVFVKNEKQSRNNNDKAIFFVVPK